MPKTTTPFELLIFDWDGTLMDSTSSIVECARLAARDAGLEPPAARAVRETIGLSLQESIRRLYPESPAADKQRWLERYRHHWISGFRGKASPFRGALEALRGFEQQSLLLAVATGKSRAGLAFDLESTGLGRFFHAMRTADEAPPKPDPGMLLEILDELGVAPADALMIGDTTFDLDMARGAGCGSVAVLSGSHSEEDLRRCRPLDCLEDVSRLPAWLQARVGRAPELLRG